MAEKKDPTQITLREAADAYNARGAGTIARFGAKGTLKQYGDMPLVQAFTPDESGVRPVDTMLEGAKSQGAANSLQDDLRLISKDVNRQIFNADPNSSALNLLPGLEANDPQTFNIFGERVSAPKQTEIAIIAQNKQRRRRYESRGSRIRCLALWNDDTHEWLHFYTPTAKFYKEPRPPSSRRSIRILTYGRTKRPNPNYFA